MGAAASIIKDQINQVSDLKGKEDEIKEALDNMVQMAQDQLDIFYQKIENSASDAKLIPINRVLSHYQYDNMGNAIQDAVKDFSTGPMSTGLANLAASVITRLVGASAGMRQTETKYAISIDPLGGISRLDTFFFVYNFEAAGLTKATKAVVASCIVKSSADTTAIDDNTLRVLINESFEASDITLRKAIYSEIREVLFNSDDKEYLKSLRDARLSNGALLAEWAKPNVNKEEAMSKLKATVSGTPITTGQENH